jgi:hypothetical protein
LFLRRSVVIAAALLLGIQVVRNAAVHASAELDPQLAARVWSSHPAVEISLGLADIGRASRERRSIDLATFALMNDAAAQAPLEAGPFLVRGVRAQMTGDDETARLAFVAAQWRDPRSLPAAYFLANYYLRHGQALQGLLQTAVLGRLSPGSTAIVAPFVATYAQNPSNWREIRSLFRSQPDLEDNVLTALAADGRNATAILAVADADHRKADSPWLPVLLSSLVSAGDYARAKAVWSLVAGGLPDRDLIFDPQFSTPGPPPPFNWTLASSGIGLAERQAGKRLHVSFYGNEDGVLASQLLLLPEGQYRLQMQLEGTSSHLDSLRWSIRCDKAAVPVADIRIDVAAKRGWTFQIPAQCPAQWLELSGRSGDFAQQAHATIGRLSIKRVVPNA